MSSAIPKPLRGAVRERAAGRCEYCLSAEIYCGFEFEVDHVVPTSAGGQTMLDNLALACSNCNAHKNARTQAHDPYSGNLTDLFHPRRHRWSDHFAWSEDSTQVIGLTATGRATVAALQMNSSVVISARTFWVDYGVHPPKSEAR